MAMRGVWWGVREGGRCEIIVGTCVMYTQRWCVPSCVLSCLRSCVRFIRFVACSRVVHLRSSRSPTHNRRRNSRDQRQSLPFRPKRKSDKKSAAEPSTPHSRKEKSGPHELSFTQSPASLAEVGPSHDDQKRCAVTEHRHRLRNARQAHQWCRVCAQREMIVYSSNDLYDIYMCASPVCITSCR